MARLGDEAAALGEKRQVVNVNHPTSTCRGLMSVLWQVAASCSKQLDHMRVAPRPCDNSQLPPVRVGRVHVLQ